MACAPVWGALAPMSLNNLLRYREIETLEHISLIAKMNIFQQDESLDNL